MTDKEKATIDRIKEKVIAVVNPPPGGFSFNESAGISKNLAIGAATLMAATTGLPFEVVGAMADAAMVAMGAAGMQANMATDKTARSHRN